MAFKLAKHATFPANVELSITGPDGEVVRGTVKGIFKRLEREQIKDFLKRYNDAIKEGRSIDSLIAEVLTGWVGMQDEDGAELPFTPENMTRAFENIPGAALAFVSSYFKHAAGGREGN